ncbi:GNAT family N-acetyltransferase [Halolamina sp. R1-12]|nr:MULTISPECIES: GNAT family protein [Halolamina]NHX35473.1 GNAT family N-acetyltransferase [Halolamina sp. R1-12]
MFPDGVVTDRLRLERVDIDDAGTLDLYEHWRADAPNVDETTEYVSWEPYATPHGVAETRERAVERTDDREGAMFLIRPRDGERGAGEFAGTAGLFVGWDCQLAVFGTWLRKPFWGRGYSGERADAMFELAFDRLDLELVRVSHLPENENSERAITKYVQRHGGRRTGRFRNRVAFDDGSVHDTVEYSVSQHEWRQADGAETAVSFQG